MRTKLFTFVMAAICLVPNSAAAAATGGTSTTDILYVTNTGQVSGDAGPSVARFGIGSDDTLTSLGSVPSGVGARPMVLGKGARFAFVSAQSGQIWSYRVGAGGALTPIGVAATTPFPFGLAISPDGQTLYSGDFSDGQLRVFAVHGGRLTLRAAVDSGAPKAKDVVTTADGRFVYVSHGEPTDTQPSLVTGFKIGPDGMPGRQVAAAQAGISGSDTVITPDGRFLYVACQGSNDVHGFAIGPHGSLTPVTTQPAGDTAEGVAASPDGKLLYVAADGGLTRPGVISGFAIGDNGALTPVGTPVPMPTTAGIAFSPNSMTLYTDDFDTSTITVFHVAASGELTAVQTLPSGGGSPGQLSITLLPAGRPRGVRGGTQ